MSNDFFIDHPMLGAAFDFNRNGSLDIAEAGAMGATAALIARQLQHEYDSEADEGDADDEDDDAGSWWDDDAGEDDDNGSGSRLYDFDLYDDDDRDIDTSSRRAVMRAIENGDYDGEIEDLLGEALDCGVRFRPKDITLISELIWDQDLLVRLIATSNPRFTQEDADELASYWGPVELEYHEDAFDEEYREGNTYHVNIL